MKNLFKILTIVSGVAVFATACSSDAKNRTQMNLKAYQDSVQKVNDSLTLDSFQRAEVAKNEAAAAKEIRSSQTTTKTVVVTQQAAAPAEKKGWSSAAKGAVIGGAAGAVTGVLIDKKDGRGAIIGGVVGAGTGYTIGREKDKKTGRVEE